MFIAFWVILIYWLPICYLRSLYRLWLSLFGVVWGPKALAVTMLVVNTYCLFRTGSLGGWIGLGAMAITLTVLLWYWWIEYLPPFWRKWLLPAVFGGMAGLLLLAIGLDEGVRLRVLRLFVGRGDSSNNFRINVWTSVVEMIKDHPIIGIGPGNTAFNKVIPLI